MSVWGAEIGAWGSRRARFWSSLSALPLSLSSQKSAKLCRPLRGAPAFKFGLTLSLARVWTEDPTPMLPMSPRALLFAARVEGGGRGREEERLVSLLFFFSSQQQNNSQRSARTCAWPPPPSPTAERAAWSASPPWARSPCSRPRRAPSCWPSSTRPLSPFSLSLLLRLSHEMVGLHKRRAGA
jgi:hypothetical protein